MIMKRISLYLAALATCGIMPSCNDRLYMDGVGFVGVMPSASPYYLYTNTLGFTFEDTLTTPLSFTVKSMDTPWKLNVADKWLKLSPMSGDGTVSPTVVNLSADINPSTFYRISIFSLESATDTAVFHYSRNIYAEQCGNSKVTLSLSSENPLFLPASASSATLTVSTNAPSYDIRLSEDWLTVEQNGNETTVSVEENTEDGERVGYVYFDAYSQKHESANAITNTFYLEIRQSAPNLTATVQELHFDNLAGTQTFSLNSDLNWEVESYDSWISVNPLQGVAGESEISVSVAENSSTSERKGYVYVIMENGETLQIPITQSGLYASADRSFLSFESIASQQQIVFETNMSSWTVLEKPEWISVSPDNGGAGEFRLNVSAEDNPNTAGRTGELIIGNEYSSVYTIEIAQEGKSFGPLESVMQFENTASSSVLSVTTDGEWTAMSGNDWITVTPTSGTGNAELTVSVSANENDEERIGEICVTVGDMVRIVNVVQKGRYFTIDRPASSSLPSTGGTIELGIATNQAWTASIMNHSPWLTLSATQGEGNANLAISAADNPSLDSRTDTIVFTPANGQQGVKLAVKQAGRYLKTNTQSVSFFSKGGTSAPVTLDTDGTFRMEKPAEATWLTANVTNNLLTFTAETYEGESQRSATVSIYLTDLAGEQAEVKMVDITVTQYSKDSQFIRNDYDEDVNLDLNTDESVTIERNDYGEDQSFE